MPLGEQRIHCPSVWKCAHLGAKGVGKALQKGAGGAGCVLAAILHGALELFRGNRLFKHVRLRVGGIATQFLFLPTRNLHYRHENQSISIG